MSKLTLKNTSKRIAGHRDRRPLIDPRSPGDLFLGGRYGYIVSDKKGEEILVVLTSPIVANRYLTSMGKTPNHKKGDETPIHTTKEFLSSFLKTAGIFRNRTTQRTYLLRWLK